MISKYIREFVAKKEYILGKHECTHFSEELKYLAEQECENLHLMNILYKDGIGHQACYYIENGIWFIEPQTNKCELLEFPDIDFIELQHPYKGFYLFSYDKKEGWTRGVYGNQIRYWWS